MKKLYRQMEYNIFDKVQYKKEFESREQELKEKTINIDEHIKNKAQEIEQDTINHYKIKEEECEREKARYIELQASEHEKINTEVEKQVTKYKIELDEQTAKERSEHEEQYKQRAAELEKYWGNRNKTLTVKFITIKGITLLVGVISAIVTIFSVVIAFTHGLLPYIVTDGKEIVHWISNNWKIIFGQPFEMAISLPPILQFALPLIFMLIVGIWAAFDFDERKWVVFADKFSLITIGTFMGISAVFSEILNYLSINTIMFPIAVYFIYVLIRFLWETGVIPKILDIIEWIINWWNGLEKNEKLGNTLIFAVLIIGFNMIKNWFKK